ncbi:hypothetical protein SAMD00019534_121490 [Acytostelium subglobosum LB1]|uniref:hypothetical protein n=1 Tax=Acytostelium subglobosum LB1 TaxID=1410327 RepID=UPI000644F707|nr:hypothetical protein SAMD00019534_121490 [Acytostelium subglobosum LB1]GAM28973.1 hypothetical protein SAMD00019534_121490 [Acytostelium subglobosum LB1]|eukprot:XP_012748158.1 hypothetical protein SAMD00019534_121490 [Acytostelium subglobosum LB1]
MTTTATTDVVVKISNLSWLHGKWSGPGNGIYPTIKPFKYTENLKFKFNGKQIEYKQTTLSASGQLMHFETGLVRVLPTGRIEMTIVQGSGVADFYEGTLETKDNMTSLTFKMTHISRSPCAREPHVTNALRQFTLDTSNNTLHVYMEMATTTTPQLVEHLRSELKKLQ